MKNTFTKFMIKYMDHFFNPSRLQKYWRMSYSFYKSVLEILNSTGFLLLFHTLYYYMTNFCSLIKTMKLSINHFYYIFDQNFSFTCIFSGIGIRVFLSPSKLKDRKQESKKTLRKNHTSRHHSRKKKLHTRDV